MIFNIKKIYIKNSSKRVRRICVDGKQRLLSIKAFINGEILYIDRFKHKWWYYKSKDSLLVSHYKRPLDLVLY